MNVADFLREQADRDGDAPAVTCAASTTSYRALRTLAEGLAAALRQLGVAAGDGLILRAANGPGFVAGLFGVLDTGAVVLPLSPRTRGPEVARMVADTRPRWLLEHDDTKPLVVDAGDGSTQQHLGDGIAVELPHAGGPWRLRELPGPRLPCVPHVPEAACIRYTSGTTAAARGVVFSHATVAARTEATWRGLQLAPGDAVVWVLPMAYHFVASIIQFVRYGLHLVLADSLLAPAILDAANRNRAKLLYATPTHYQLLATDSSGQRFETLALALSTSAGVGEEVCAAFVARYGLPLTQAYGVIEVGLPLMNRRAAGTRPAAVGHAQPDYEAAILDDEGRAMTPPAVGHLALRGPGMFDAYLSPPQPRSEVLEDGWFLTGDLATMDADGLVTVCGRRTAMINVGGNKVFPETVERVVLLHPAVAVARAYRVAHTLLGEAVAVEIVPYDDPNTLDVAAIRRHCRAHLESWQVPVELHVVAAIATTVTGKMIRRTS